MPRSTVHRGRKEQRMGPKKLKKKEIQELPHKEIVNAGTLDSPLN